MKGKEIMVVSIIIIILLIIIIVGVNAKKDKEEINEIGTENVENINENEGKEEKEPLGEFEKELLDGTKINISEEFSKTKEIEGLEISNIKLIESNNTTKLIAEVKNISNEKNGDFGVKIQLVDKDGKEIATMLGYIDNVETGEVVELNASIGQDVVNAYNFIISK